MQKKKKKNPASTNCYICMVWACYNSMSSLGILAPTCGTVRLLCTASFLTDLLITASTYPSQTSNQRACYSPAVNFEQNVVYSITKYCNDILTTIEIGEGSLLTSIISSLTRAVRSSHVHKPRLHGHKIDFWKPIGLYAKKWLSI